MDIEVTVLTVEEIGQNLEGHYLIPYDLSAIPKNTAN
jgi:hypothetical protein